MVGNTEGKRVDTFPVHPPLLGRGLTGYGGAIQVGRRQVWYQQKVCGCVDGKMANTFNSLEERRI